MMWRGSLALAASCIFWVATHDFAAAQLLEEFSQGAFRSVWMKDRRICKALLESFNRGKAIPDELRGSNNHNRITDLLLTTDLQIDWTRRPLENSGGTGELDYAFVDIANNGHQTHVARWDHWSHMSGGHHNILMLPPSIPAELSSGESLPSTIVSQLLGTEARNLMRFTSDSSSFWQRNAFQSNENFILDLAEVEGRVVILAAGTQNAEDAATRHGNLDVFVLEYHSPKDIPVLCHLRGERR